MRISTWRRIQRLGSTEHDTAGLDSITTLPDHRDNWASRHVFDESREERLALKVGIIYVSSIVS